MIEINIAEAYYPEDPKQAAILRTDCEKFIEGFKKLCNLTNMHNVDVYNLFSANIPTKLRFNDGSSIGMGKLFEEIGFE